MERFRNNPNFLKIHLNLSRSKTRIRNKWSSVWYFLDEMKDIEYRNRFLTIWIPLYCVPKERSLTNVAGDVIISKREKRERRCSLSLQIMPLWIWWMISHRAFSDVQLELVWYFYSLSFHQIISHIIWVQYVLTITSFSASRSKTEKCHISRVIDRQWKTSINLLSIVNSESSKT